MLKISTKNFRKKDLEDFKNIAMITGDYYGMLELDESYLDLNKTRDLNDLLFQKYIKSCERKEVEKYIKTISYDIDLNYIPNKYERPAPALTYISFYIRKNDSSLYFLPTKVKLSGKIDIDIKNPPLKKDTYKYIKIYLSTNYYIAFSILKPIISKLPLTSVKMFTKSL